jgi:hypothetical protein
MPNSLEPYHERGFRFACSVVRLYLELVRLPHLPPHLARQVLKSGTSIGANLEALKEARETLYWLRLLLATGLVEPKLVQPHITEANELVAILTVTRRKLSKPMTPGSK